MVKKLTRFICLVLVVCVLFASAALAGSGRDMTREILDRFMPLTRIPRPSGHEEAVSAYLETWGLERGFRVIRDAANNVIIDVLATAGYEDAPLTALQCHMDMVFAQKDDLGLDPLTTPITVKNDGVWLTSDGNTSLGADDGIGIAVMLCVADGLTAHGPLRLLITTEEETTMDGTHALDPALLSGVRYLINIDSETEGEMCVSSACGDKIIFSKAYDAAARAKEKTYEIELSGLSGGHSGIQIDKNHLNAGMEMGMILDELRLGGIDFELARLIGGTADNAIMTDAKAFICADEKDAARLAEIVDICRERLTEKGGKTDPGLTLTLRETDGEDRVLPANEKDAVLAFLTGFKNGVRTMSDSIPGLVECSCNLGIIDVNPAGFTFVALDRSSSAERETEQLNEQQALAEKLGCGMEVKHSGDSWEYKPGSKLEKLFTDAYRALFGTELKVIAVHAGLECGTYAIYNPDMDIVSVGPTIKDPHSIMEKLEIASIERVWNLLSAVLSAIG